MEQRLIIGLSNLDEEETRNILATLDFEKVKVSKIESLDKFIKTTWINNIDVLILNDNNISFDTVKQIEEKSKKGNLSVITVGDNYNLSEVKYGFSYSEENKKEISNGVVRFITDSLWARKNNAKLDKEVDKKVKKAEEEELFNLLMTLVELIEEKDNYTKQHCERVAKYAYLLCEKAGLTEIEKERVYRGALIHDVGKIGVLDEIIFKKDMLDNDECDLMRKHTLIIDDLLSNRYFAKLKPIIRAHHERYDGKGYPDNLMAESIPLEARIIAIADSFDAMTTKRGYNSPKSLQEAINELRKNSGTQFDPNLVPLFVEVLDDLLQKDEKYPLNSEISVMAKAI